MVRKPFDGVMEGTCQRFRRIPMAKNPWIACVRSRRAPTAAEETTYDPICFRLPIAAHVLSNCTVANKLCELLAGQCCKPTPAAKTEIASGAQAGNCAVPRNAQQHQINVPHNLISHLPIRHKFAETCLFQSANFASVRRGFSVVPEVSSAQAPWVPLPSSRPQNPGRAIRLTSKCLRALRAAQFVAQRCPRNQCASGCSGID